MTKTINVAVAGARGRMGLAVLAALKSDADCALAGELGRGAVDARQRSEIIKAADVIIDFTAGRAASKLAETCARNGGPALVIGATGFEASDLDRICQAANHIPILRSGNFSIGLNYLAALITRLARDLPADIWDIEILEAHHRNKTDAPSGTALMIGEAAALGRGVPLAAVERRIRDGDTGERPVGEIGFSVVRAGAIVGEHSVLFAAPEENITLSHSALDRGMFARGALRAAKWILGCAPGEYTMQDVLGNHADRNEIGAPLPKSGG